MNDQRIEKRTLLGLEDLRGRLRPQRIGSEAVNRLRWQAVDLAGGEQLCGIGSSVLELRRRPSRCETRVHYTRMSLSMSGILAAFTAARSEAPCAQL